MAKSLKIRGHHLLCIFGFRGHGYSDTFVSNMRTVTKSFFAKGGAEVELTAECDDICRACPHMLERQCAAEEGAERRVQDRDREVLARLGLAGGQQHDATWLAALVTARVSPAALAELCAGCQWLPAGYCQQGISEYRCSADGAGRRSSRASGKADNSAR